MERTSISRRQLHAETGRLTSLVAWDRNGVIDREELRALLESTDSGAQYSITVSSSSVRALGLHGTGGRHTLMPDLRCAALAGGQRPGQDIEEL